MLKKLLRSVREYKKDSLLTPLFVTLEVIMEVLIPFFMANIIDIGMANENMPHILRMGGILVLAALLSLWFGALSGKYAANASAGFAKNLRHDLFDCIQNFSFANIDRFSTASLVTRLTTDVTNVQNAYQMVIRILIRAPVMLVFALIMAININLTLPNGYDTLLGGDGDSLSQGQRQLLAIARAAVANPPVLILDEATSSIDTRTEALVQQGMDSLMQGRTVFVIAHRLSTIRNADAIMVLEHGRIIERGGHAELLANKGTYHQLYTGALELA